MQLKRGVRLGRPFGIPLGVHGSWLPAAALLALHLSYSVYGELEVPATVLFAVTTTAGFFLSVVLHEVAHGVVARGMGLGVAGVTLFVFGGIARISRESSRPAQEIVIAAAGPVSSAAVGAALLAFAPVAPSPDDPSGRLLLCLGAANLAVAVFNLLPGFPLDGGRILRAVLWRLDGDATRATQRSARAGQVVGASLAAAGLALFVGFGAVELRTGALEGLWLVVVGAFVTTLATAARRSASVARELEGQQAGPWARPFGGAVTPDDLVTPVTPNGKAPLAVTDRGRLTGVLPVGLEVADRGRPARDHMVPWTPRLAYRASDPLPRALELLARGRSGLLVVLDERGSVVGVLDHEGVRDRLRERTR